MPAAFRVEGAIPSRICCVCRCSDIEPCETANGSCGWAGVDLCTACEGRSAEVYAALVALHAAAAGILAPRGRPRIPKRLQVLSRALRRARHVLS